MTSSQSQANGSSLTRLQPQKLKEERRKLLVRLLEAFQRELESEGDGSGQETVGMVRRWVAHELETYPPSPPDTWFEPGDAPT